MKSVPFTGLEEGGGQETLSSDAVSRMRGDHESCPAPQGWGGSAFGPCMRKNRLAERGYGSRGHWGAAGEAEKV